MRHFIFSATYTIGYKTITRNFGTIREVFLTNNQFKGIIKELNPNNELKDIVILSVCEVSKEDFETFWSAT
jgi:hypothetical protein